MCEQWAATTVPTKVVGGHKAKRSLYKTNTTVPPPHHLITLESHFTTLLSDLSHKTAVHFVYCSITGRRCIYTDGISQFHCTRWQQQQIIKTYSLYHHHHRRHRQYISSSNSSRRNRRKREREKWNIKLIHHLLAAFKLKTQSRSLLNSTLSCIKTIDHQ